MIMTRNSIRNYLKVLDDLDVRIIDTEVTGSNHYKITVTSSGKQRFFIASQSGSDHRALRNFRAMVKRWKQNTQENFQ